jgi:hypothetical protein
VAPADPTIYKVVKREFDSARGIVSQVIVASKASGLGFLAQGRQGDPRSGTMPQSQLQFAANVGLKVNHKLGGRNMQARAPLAVFAWLLLAPQLADCSCCTWTTLWHLFINGAAAAARLRDCSCAAVSACQGMSELSPGPEELGRWAELPCLCGRTFQTLKRRLECAELDTNRQRHCARNPCVGTPRPEAQ